MNNSWKNMPTRTQKGSSGIPENVKRCIAYWLIFRCEKETAVKLFVLSESKPTKAKMADTLWQIWESEEGKAYIDGLTRELDNHFGIGDRAIMNTVTEMSEEDLSELKSKARRQIEQDVMTRIDSEATSGQISKETIDIADKIGLVDATQTISEPPRRYLPESCGGCRYKLYVADNCDDFCDCCEYKIYANKQGLRLDNKTQINQEKWNKKEELRLSRLSTAGQTKTEKNGSRKR